MLAQYGSLDAALAAGRFDAEADALRLYLRLATLDPTAPLPPLEGQTPRWAEGEAFARELGLTRLAERIAALSTS